MQTLFLNVEILEQIVQNWNIDMQACAYLCSLNNIYVQYK